MNSIRLDQGRQSSDKDINTVRLRLFDLASEGRNAGCIYRQLKAEFPGIEPGVIADCAESILQAWPADSGERND